MLVSHHMEEATPLTNWIKYNLNYLNFDVMYVDFKNDDTRFTYYGYQNELSVITRDPDFDLEAFAAGKSKQKN